MGWSSIRIILLHVSRDITADTPDCVTQTAPDPDTRNDEKDSENRELAHESFFTHQPIQCHDGFKLQNTSAAALLLPTLRALPIL